MQPDAWPHRCLVLVEYRRQGPAHDHDRDPESSHSTGASSIHQQFHRGDAAARQGVTLMTPATGHSATDHPIIVEHLTKRYGDHTVVDDLSFTVEPGRVTDSSVPTAPASPPRRQTTLDLARANGGQGNHRRPALSGPRGSGQHRRRDDRVRRLPSRGEAAATIFESPTRPASPVAESTTSSKKSA